MSDSVVVKDEMFEKPKEQKEQIKEKPKKERKKRVYTDEQKKAMVERMKAGKAKKKAEREALKAAPKKEEDKKPLLSPVLEEEKVEVENNWKSYALRIITMKKN